jgi:hypothetical protein
MPKKKNHNLKERGEMHEQNVVMKMKKTGVACVKMKKNRD